MSKLLIGKDLPHILINIDGLDIKPITEKSIVFMFSNPKGDKRFTIEMNQKTLRNVAQLLAYPPDPCPDHLVLDVTPENETIEHKIALDGEDRELIEKVLKNAPSLLSARWLSEEDANKLMEVFEGFAEKVELDPQRN
jgi:excinuclease UvrABC nuclease subunit